MKTLLAIAALLSIGAAAPARSPVPATATRTDLYCVSIPFDQLPAGATCESGAMPPDRFTGDATATISFVRDIDAACGIPPEGKHWGGCTRKGIIYISPPCPIGLTDDYARRLCHELAHLRFGWPAWHGQ
jgi:hypothetical protein